MHKGMQELLARGSLWMKNEGINRVRCLDGDIRMENIRIELREELITLEVGEKEVITRSLIAKKFRAKALRILIN